MRRLWLLVGLLALGWSSGAGATPVQWTAASGGNGHFYEAILVLEGIDWTAANSAAQAQPGAWYLATITSAAENAFVYSLFSGNPDFFNSAYYDTGPWLGATHSGPDAGDYAWVTGEEFSYANWAPPEPYGNGDRISFFGF